MSGSFDLAVIGSGPGGYRAAVLGALRGLDVAIVERADWGGCCLNRGCVPKRDWYHTARILAAQRHFEARGLRGGPLSGDLAQAWQHQRGVVERVRDSYRAYLKHLKVRAIEGHARFLGPEEIRVEGPNGIESLRARHSIIATGAAAKVPAPFEPVDGRVLTTDMLFDHPPPPGRRVAVVGSGVVATEFAFILGMLGHEVTWLVRSAPLARLGFSPQALSVLRAQFAFHGIEPQRISGYSSVRLDGEHVHIDVDGGASFEVDWVVLGTGRSPMTKGLGLDSIGVHTDHQGFVERDDQLRTAVPNIYAIGDVAGHWMTANHALSDATVAIENILGGARRQDGRFVPMVIYSAVEMARLGLDEDAAEDEDLEPAIGFAAFETSPCALGQDAPEGFVRLIGELDSGVLLGGEIIGGEAGELIHLLSLAPDRETALAWLARGTWNHPARAEEILNATETLASKWNLQEQVFGASGSG
jgi:dihydrolipoamide dehydrogenase